MLTVIPSRGIVVNLTRFVQDHGALPVHFRFFESPVAACEPPLLGSRARRPFYFPCAGYCSPLEWLLLWPYGLIGGLATCRVVRGLCFLGTRPRVAQRLAGSYTQLFELPAHHLLYASSGLMFR